MTHDKFSTVYFGCLMQTTTIVDSHTCRHTPIHKLSDVALHSHFEMKNIEYKEFWHSTEFLFFLCLSFFVVFVFWFFIFVTTNSWRHFCVAYITKCTSSFAVVADIVVVVVCKMGKSFFFKIRFEFNCIWIPFNGGWNSFHLVFI